MWHSGQQRTPGLTFIRYTDCFFEHAGHFKAISQLLLFEGGVCSVQVCFHKDDFHNFAFAGGTMQPTKKSSGISGTNRFTFRTQAFTAIPFLARSHSTTLTLHHPRPISSSPLKHTWLSAGSGQGGGFLYRLMLPHIYNANNCNYPQNNATYPPDAFRSGGINAVPFDKEP